MGLSTGMAQEFALAWGCRRAAVAALSTSPSLQNRNGDTLISQRLTTGLDCCGWHWYMERVCTSAVSSVKQSAITSVCRKCLCLSFAFCSSRRRTPGVMVPLANGKELLSYSPRMSVPSGKASPRVDPWI